MTVSLPVRTGLNRSLLYRYCPFCAAQVTMWDFGEGAGAEMTECPHLIHFRRAGVEWYAVFSNDKPVEANTTETYPRRTT